MTQRLIDLERRLRQFVQRGIIISGDPGGPYAVAITDEYGNTMLIEDVLYRPFVTEVTTCVEPHGEMTVGTSSSGSPGHSHSVTIPEHEHEDVQIVLPLPERNDTVIVWFPTGLFSETSLIVGRWTNA